MPSNRSTKRMRWLIAAAILVVVLVIIFLWQRNLLLNYNQRGGSKPHLSVKQIHVHDIGADKISMTARIMVSNPLLIELRADKLEYELLIDSVLVMQTEFKRHVAIKSLDSVMLTLPIEVLRDSVVQVLDRFKKDNADSAVYTLKARLYFEVPVAGDKIYKVNEAKKGPAFRLLEVHTKDVDIEKFGLRNSDLSMSLVVENPNSFPIAIKDVDYKLLIGKDFRMSGHVDDVIDIPARSTIELPLEMDIHTNNLPRLTWQVLFEKKHTPFEIDFEGKIVGTDETFRDTRLHLRRTGRVDELKKLVPE